MRIVFLNTWNGIQSGFGEFVSEQAPQTDVFCFQEVYPEVKGRLAHLLPNYHLVDAYKENSADDNFPQATYIRDGMQILKWSPVLAELNGTGLGIFTEISKEGQRANLCNFHGTARPGNKLDTAQRLQQTEGLLAFFATLNGPKIIGGDFNLDHAAKSIQMFEQAGYRNLVKEFGITNTRNRLVWERYPASIQHHSSYVFVSKEIKVANFSVPQPEEFEISDHQPLILEVRL